MKFSSIYTLIISLLASFIITAQELTPPIQNFSSVDYQAASQNWDIKVDEDGFIYAANSQGLLFFDGLRWKLFPLKNNSIIRSVYPFKDRIYVGSYQEFGYWKRDEDGQLGYTSLMPLIGDYNFQSEEFWEILPFNDAIYFRSFGAIYKYEENTIKSVVNAVTNKMMIYNDQLLVAVNYEGLHYLKEDGELVPLNGQEELVGKIIVDMELVGENLYIATRDSLYIYKEGLRKYPGGDLNELLQSSEPNQLLALAEDELVIGTVKNGIVHLKEQTGDYEVLNHHTGLQNNTVLSLAHKDGRLWIGLDDGIDVVKLNFPIQFYTNESGELGAVYDLANYQNELFVASNTGVYKMGLGNRLEMLEGAEGHSWNLEVVNNKLYSNHNTGTFRVDDNAFIPIDRRTGSFQILNAKEDRHLIGSYSGIDVYSEDTQIVKTIEGTLFPAKQLIFEDPSTVWAAHAYEGLFRINLTPSLDSATHVRKVLPPDRMETHNARVFNINNNIAALIGGEWFRYNVFKDSLEVFDEMTAFNNYKLINEETDFFWFLNMSNQSLLGTDFKDSKILLTSEMLNNRMVKGDEKIIRQNDSTFLITLHDGFARIELDELLSWKERESLSKPVILGLTDNKGSYPLNRTAEIPYQNSREITFALGLPFSDANSLRYELVGEDTLRDLVQQGELKFQNLSHGEYELRLMATSPQNNVSEITTYDFEVLAPWYLSVKLKIVYFLLFLGIISTVYYFNRRKLRKHRLVLEQRYQREHQEQLNQLEKEKLLNEITLKRKELANSTLVAARKNEVLMEIQKELGKDKNKISNEYRLKHILKKINRAINDKDAWEVFETNFNELHEDFFKELLEKYPNLSNKDLKLCSYLKMNLTSKEIAPLLGISVRGVEVHRYRLRKKMKLDSSENLTNFLIRNF